MIFKRAFAEEAMRILEAANEKGIVLRLVGALAFEMHCPKSSARRKTLGREISDIDFMGYSKQCHDVIEFFKHLGYLFDERQYVFADYRLFFHHKVSDIDVDIFFDKFMMCHMIDLRKRLEVDYPTISLADMLLTKMQIVKITEKDMIDTLCLLEEHNVGDGDEEMINCEYISKLLSGDWGFYYTVTTNLKKIRDVFLPEYAYSEENKAMLEAKINAILDRIEGEPKSFKWKMRAQIGTKRKWYEEVEEMPNFK